MITNLFPFQQKAVEGLREASDDAIANYAKKKKPQAISFTAPTGAGKTIMIAALIESIYTGSSEYPEQSDAIFVWLSDSPELNKQSKEKIERQADKISAHRCTEIDESSFNQKYLDDGNIYFLNTQKLGKGGNLTRHGNNRTYTIWETLENTVKEKYDRLYVVIDEAHRGMLGKDASRATTIMQRFLKGYPEGELDPMPVVIGMSATTERFNNLVSGITSTVHQVVVTPDEVRDSGLLKDRIIIKYPGDSSSLKEMAILSLAAKEWRDKWNRWEKYCKNTDDIVKPVFVVQVEDAAGGKITSTDLNIVIKTIEEAAQINLSEYEVVHTFGQTESDIPANGINIKYEEPSRISEDDIVKVVLFKQNLSVGWDCPRAETMMSFRRASDYTYIAQLLGRMIRTPLQRHIDEDDFLNEVTLFLPHFDKDAVAKVIKELKGNEGATIPADVEGQEIESKEKIWVSAGDTPIARWNQVKGGKKDLAGQIHMSENPQSDDSLDMSNGESNTEIAHNNGASVSVEQTQVTSADNTPSGTGHMSTHPSVDNNVSGGSSTPATPQIDVTTTVVKRTRADIVDYINASGLTTYKISKHSVSNYLIALFDLTHLLTVTNIDLDVNEKVKYEIVGMIESYIADLKANSEYDSLIHDFEELIITSQVYDSFGDIINTLQRAMYASTSDDIDRQFRKAEKSLADVGIGLEYKRRAYDLNNTNSASIDVILFANDHKQMVAVLKCAEEKFHDLRDTYRLRFAGLDAKTKSEYSSIIQLADEVAELNYVLPNTVYVDNEPLGVSYSDHLFLNQEGEIKLNLDNWERDVIEEERQRDDYVCFVRNKEKKPWALSVHYNQGKDDKLMYPDFLIIRDVENVGLVVDILEPHRGDLDDNLYKGQGLAKYAQKNPLVGRVQMIRKGKNGAGKDCYLRLDLAKGAVQKEVLAATTDVQFDSIFAQYGESDT